MVDTGASRTIISDRDASWLGIDYGKLRKTDSSLGIGGSVDAYEISQATLTFTTEGKPFMFTSKIFVIEHRKVDERVRRIPSILGRNFLNSSP